MAIDEKQWTCIYRSSTVLTLSPSGQRGVSFEILYLVSNQWARLRGKSMLPRRRRDATPSHPLTQPRPSHVVVTVWLLLVAVAALVITPMGTDFLSWTPSRRTALTRVPFFRS